MFFDVKQLSDLKSGSWIYLGAVKRLRNGGGGGGGACQPAQDAHEVSGAGLPWLEDF